jgi:arylsulfatase A-like enzyme
VPNRLDLFTGRYTSLYFDWAPLPRHETVLAQVLSSAGVLTYLVADTYNLFRDGYNFDRGFAGFEWIRGNGADRWRTSPADPDLGFDPTAAFDLEGYTKPHFRNAAATRYEDEAFTAQTFRAAARWLEENRSGRFYLHIDTFDPHEPWHPPPWYVDLYDPGYTGQVITHPKYADIDFLRPEELRHCRALYAGAVTMMDRWLGYFLGRLEDLGLLEDTAVIFTTDHGFFLGEHRWIGKTRLEAGIQYFRPLYEELAHVPLITYVPGLPGGRRTGILAQPVDLMPTVLELMGVTRPDSVQGSSWLPALRGEGARFRDIAVSSPALHHRGRWRPSTITDGEWTLIFNGLMEEARPDWTVWAVDGAYRSETRPSGQHTPELYHLPSDPGQARNLFVDAYDVAVGLHRRYVDFLDRYGLPESALELRRRLPSKDEARESVSAPG